MRTLVIGNGLIGGALCARPGMHPLVGVPWGDHAAAMEMLAESARAWMVQGGDWAIAWCAGSGVVGSDESTVAAETECLQAVLDVRPRGNGRFLFTSSGGGLYGHGTETFIDESTEPDPVSAYGFAKLAQEQLVTQYAEHWDVPSIIVRPSNVYGPGQRLNKPQGLISKILHCLHDDTALSLSVPIDTERDYVWAADAGTMMARLLASVPQEPLRKFVLASGVSYPISEIISIAEKVTGGKLRIEHAARSFQQPRRLAFRPSCHPVGFTPLDVGMSRMWEAIR